MATKKGNSKSHTSLYESIRKEVENELKDAKIAARNVLEDLQAEKEKIAEINAKDEAILESMGEGMLAVDNDKKIMVINKVALSMLGWEMKDLIGKAITDLPLSDEAGDIVPLEKRPTTIALKTDEITKATYFLNRKDKTRFPIAITATPIKLGSKTLGLIEILRDVTIEKEIDKAKSEFVSLASHQLRTPLTAISWYTEMILNGDVGLVIPEQKKYLEKVYEGNKRMVELVNTLLDVSRIDLGTFKIEPVPVDIIALAAGAIDDSKIKIEAKKLTVVKNFSKKLPVILSDPKLLLMVLQNIFNNALEYTPKGGRIEFSISSDSAFSHKSLSEPSRKKILVKISDTGYGIPADDQGKIFTKFFRADNVRDKDANGTGLGLYIAKSIIENLGGKIWFESKEGKGTTFYLVFYSTAVESE